MNITVWSFRYIISLLNEQKMYSRGKSNKNVLHRCKSNNIACNTVANSYSITPGIQRLSLAIKVMHHSSFNIHTMRKYFFNLTNLRALLNFNIKRTTSVLNFDLYISESIYLIFHPNLNQ